MTIATSFRQLPSDFPDGSRPVLSLRRRLTRLLFNAKTTLLLKGDPGRYAAKLKKWDFITKEKEGGRGMKPGGPEPLPKHKSFGK